MATSGVLLQALVSFYGNLTLDVVNALSATQQDIRTGDFSCDKTLGRAIKVGLDATEGWLSAVLVTASHPLPTLYLTVGNGTTASETVSVLVQDTPQCTDLFQIGGRHHIASKDVTLTTSTKGDSITVSLPGWAKVKSQIVPGLYQGLIYTGAKSLAVVMLRYDPTYKEGEPTATTRTNARRTKRAGRRTIKKSRRKRP